MSVHYKFKSALTFDTITFDGLHISVKDLKKDILQQKQIGKTADFDLQITNAQTNEVYVDENTLIPKNSSLIVVRVPLTAQQKRAWEKAEANQQLVGGKPIGGIFEGQDPGAQRLAKTVDLSSVDASEDDKIAAMMTQSTFDYDPSNYLRIRGSCQVGEVPASYRCYKCHQPGHWIKDCKLSLSTEPVEIRKSTGIPRNFLVPVEGPAVPGAMMTPSGQFAVPSIDHQAYMEGKKPSAPEAVAPEKPNIPEDLVCGICHDLLTDTVMVHCCGTSFCDECIRMVLLESENHQCPDCKQQGVSPETLIPNRYLRNAVNNFRNQTGYQRAPHSHVSNQVTPDVAYHHSLPAQSSSLVVVNTAEPLHPPGNIPPSQPILPIQAISTVHGRPAPQARPVAEIVNLIETSDNSASPIQLIETIDSHKPQRGKNIPLLTNSYNLPSEPIPVIPSKGVDVEPLQLPKRTQMTPVNMDSRPGFSVSKVEERAPTPTIDERSTGQPLPSTFTDTSVPPPIQPVQTYPIQPIGSVIPFQASFPGGPYPRAGPIMPMYPSINTQGPRPNYQIDPSRGMRNSSGYSRNYSRNRGNRGGHSYRGSSNNIQSGQIIEDPWAAFEKMLKDKDSRYRLRRRRSFSRSRSRTRSRTRSPLPRKRSRSRSITPRISRSRSRSLSPQRLSRRDISRSHSVSPRPTRTPPKVSKPASRSPVRSRTRSRSRSVSRARSRSRSRSPLPTKRRTRSFTISRSRSRSLSRSPSPLRRDRHFSPHRHDVRYRSSPRTSPQRYGSRSKDYDSSHAYYEPDIRRGRGRGRFSRGRGNMTSNDYKDQYYSPSNTRYDSRYEPNQSSRSYLQSSTVSDPLSQPRFNNRRFEPFDIIPPGTGPDLPTSYRGYQDDYLAPPGVGDHRIVTFPSEGKRDRDRDSVGMRESVRDLAARDWERTRDREIEQRERERQREYDDRYGYQKRQQSQSPTRDKHRKRSHEQTKENKHHPVQAIESVTREYFNSESKEEGRARIPVLVDLKKEPSVEKEKKKDGSVPPVKEKKKEKEKRKKRKEGEGEKKKKKKKEKKDLLAKGKVEVKDVFTPVNADKNGILDEVKKAVPLVPEKIDPLYGDIEGTSVDQTVVENYVKLDEKKTSEECEITRNTNGGDPKDTNESKEPVVLAPLPEISKWELEDDLPNQEDKSVGEDGSGKDKKIVTSEVLKRAENAIFQKAINAIRPFETGKKPVVPEKSKEKKDVPEQPIQQKSTEPVVDTREARKIANTIQITIPTSLPSRASERSVEVATFPVEVDSTKVKTRLDRSKFTPTSTVLPSTSPVRLSAKERLGAKVDQEERIKDDSKRVRSAVERKSKSRSPRKFLDRKMSDRDKHRDLSPGRESQRRVVVSSRVIGRVDSRDRERSRDRDRERSRDRDGERSRDRDRRNTERERSRSRERRHREKEKKRERSSSRERRYKRDKKHEKEERHVKKKDEKPEERQVTVKLEAKVNDKKGRKNPRLAIDRKKVTLDEASFEPDYDESTSPESEPEVPGEEKSLLINIGDKNISPVKKRSRSVSIENVKKKQKSEAEEEKSDEKVIKDNDKSKKTVESEESSDTDSSSESSSDSSVEAKKKHRKKKKSKKRKKKKSRKRKDSSSESDSSDSSSSDSDSAKGKKKKHKHRSKKRKSKKSKKSKHK